jgi:hypothetical protein
VGERGDGGGWPAPSGLENIPSGPVPRALPWAVVGRPVGAGVIRFVMLSHSRRSGRVRDWKLPPGEGTRPSGIWQLATGNYSLPLTPAGRVCDAE